MNVYHCCLYIMIVFAVYVFRAIHQVRQVSYNMQSLMAITTGLRLGFSGWRECMGQTMIVTFLYFVDLASCYKFLLLTNLMHFFMYYFISLHVLCITVFIIRRSNCIHTSSAMISLCKWPLKQSFTQTNHTRWCINTFQSPDDEHCDARNM